ncbi:hypothetical protein RBH29_11710 [Herbivorax sp. ANBcel31]|uniref:hypothetical protein n=1 Tax=Herbivorax sp. ANBcel31 TaxID=3069754 RepID=UPI0027B4AC70|nr:hypothetical protein [Herbivorax sp. ANBcel31]MDQ2087091.1 hypothetical protein [Herbivorax sp. ANBcel31]
MKKIDIFPDIQFEREPETENLQIQTYGRRITSDQTVPEYLLEFLLVFIGMGEKINEKGLKKIDESIDKPIKYRIMPNIGLKRFVFFENSKNENKYKADRDAYKKLRNLLENNVDTEHFDKSEVISIIQDLFYGFSAVTKNRGWFAQSLLPICEQTIFPEAMGKKADRSNLDFYKKEDEVDLNVDTKFEFNEHNFLARGGEVYFLHLLQGFDKLKETKYKESIENNLTDLINSFPQFSILSNWILNTWSDYLNESTNTEINFDKIKECKWIPEEYERRSAYTVKELNNILLSDTSEFEKLDLLSIGIVFQLLRMMTEVAASIAKGKKGINPTWLIHIPSQNVYDKKIKKLAVRKYKEIEENMEIAVAQMLENKEKMFSDNVKRRTTKERSHLSLLKKAHVDSHKLLRKLGKEIGLIIPLSGDNMRMTLTDSLIRFIVLSIVPPESKITIDLFLKKLYEHYGIIIGSRGYSNELNDTSDVSYLQNNLVEFQTLLRKNGFLRELSDATSIVENPYDKVGGVNT